MNRRKAENLACFGGDYFIAEYCRNCVLCKITPRPSMGTCPMCDRGPAIFLLAGRPDEDANKLISTNSTEIPGLAKKHAGRTFKNARKINL